MADPGLGILTCDKLHQGVKYECDLCGLFGLRSNLITHINSVHKQLRPFECVACGAKFGRHHHLKGHTVLSHSSTRLQCGNGFSPSTCDQCNSVSNTKYNLLAHMKSVHGIGGIGYHTFTCDLCDKSFKWKTNLLGHNRATHLQIRVFKCQLCEATFTKKPLLKQHQDNIHQGIRYECDVCEKLFGSRVNLSTHINSVHKQLLPFECVVCGAKFSRRHHLKGHACIAVSHTSTRFQCDECDASVCKSYLAKHIHSLHLKLRRQYNCDQCPAAFNLPMNVKRHEKNVHKIKTLICDICSKTVSQKIQLVLHCLGVHMKLRLFKCSQCALSFTASSTLARHNKIAHH